MIKKQLLDKLDSFIKQQDQSNEIDRKISNCRLLLSENLDFFKHKAPKIYDEYQNHISKDHVFELDNCNQENLLNTKKHCYLYKSHFKDITKNQVEEFIHEPNQINITFKKTDTLSAFFKEPQVINSFFDELNTDSLSSKFPESLQTIGFLIVIGIGLGEHIKLLTKKYRIQHLIIIEPEPDIFYESLHVINWAEIASKFSSNGKSINFFLNKSAPTVLNNLAALYTEKGQLYVASTYIFAHTHCNKSMDILKTLQNHFSNTVSTQGFLEDEHLSFAHSLINLNQRIPIINNYKIKSPPPCLICGNGPSLEQSLPFIRKVQNNYLIVSCGSTLGTLVKADIIPDIHIELERTVVTTESLVSLGISEDVYKNILFIGISSVPPETFALFDKKIMTLKSNDTGKEFLECWLKKTIPSMKYCNPTVTNAGLSILLHLGVKKIYLAGVDLGTSDKNIHHALSSAYYEEENASFQAFQVNENTIEYPGNLQEIIYTNPELIQSNINISELLCEYTDCDIYNLSNGAKINNTKPMTHEEWIKHAHKKINKEEYLAEIEKKSCSSISKENLINQTEAEQLLAPTLNILDKLANVSVSNVKNISQLYAVLNQLIITLTNLTQHLPICSSLINGSLHKLVLYIYLHALNSKDPIPVSLQFSIKKYNQFIIYCLKLLKEHISSSHYEMIKSEEVAKDEEK